MVKKAIDRDPPHQDNIDKEFVDNLIKPFRTPNGAVVTQTSSIALLNRYCMSLPADQFTVSAVTWSKTTTKSGEIIVKVLLPIQSAVNHEISVRFNSSMLHLFPYIRIYFFLLSLRGNQCQT